MVSTAMLRKERPPHETDVVPTPSDYPYISSSPPACFIFISSLSPPFQQQFSSQKNGSHLISLVSYWNFIGKPGNSSFFCHVDGMCQVQIVNLSVFKITSKHEGGATPAALQIKHCAGASSLIVSGVHDKIQCTVS